MKVVVDRAVKIIGAGFCDDIDDSAESAAVFSAEAAIDHAKFSDRFLRRCGALRTSGGIDVVCAVAGRLTTGALLTLNAAGDGPSGCSSQITFFYTEAMVRIDAWGAWREIAVAGARAVREEVEIMDNPLKSFLSIRAGDAENLATLEAGLRFARLWDAIKGSAARDGEPVAVWPSA